MPGKLFLAVCTLVLGAVSFAQDHDPGPGKKLGTVHFSTSCNEAAQKVIDRTVALLHSFQFSRAIEGFHSALRSDSTCGIAYSGIALSQPKSSTQATTSPMPTCKRRRTQQPNES